MWILFGLNVLFVFYGDLSILSLYENDESVPGEIQSVRFPGHGVLE